MINSFRGEYSFLSNFYIDYDGSSVECKYQAEKTIDPLLKEKILSKSPKEAKRLGRTCKIRNNWNQVKDDIMFNLLVQKFSKPHFAKKLIQTKNEELVEGNYWHDNYWGQCTCPNCRNKGKNILGKMLMRIRDELLKTNLHF